MNEEAGRVALGRGETRHKMDENMDAAAALKLPINLKGTLQGK